MPNRRLIQGYGKEMFRVKANQHIENIDVRNVGNGLVRVFEDTDGLVIRNISVENGYRVLEVYPGKGASSASAKNLLIEDVTAKGLIRGFARIGGNSAGGIIRRCIGQGTQHSADIPCGLAFSGTAHGFSIEECVMNGFRMNLPEGKYQNGDGYSTELGNYGFRFLRCEASDNTDGGFDLKSSGTFLDSCTAARNKYNYRFWSTIEAYVLTSLDPVEGKRKGYGHFSLTADQGPTVVTIHKLIAKSSTRAPLFHVHRGDIHIIVKSHDISLPPGTPLLVNEGNAKISWETGPPKL